MADSIDLGVYYEYELEDVGTAYVWRLYCVKSSTRTSMCVAHGRTITRKGARGAAKRAKKRHQLEQRATKSIVRYRL